MKNAVGFLSSSFFNAQMNNRLIAPLQACYLYGVDAYVYPLSEVNTYIDKGYINAYQWIDGELKKCQTDLPKYTEIYFSTSKLAKIYSAELQWLKEHTTLTDDFGLSKAMLQHALLKSDLSPYAIPTFCFKTYSELCNLLFAIPNAIVKPSGGTKGLGIMKLSTLQGKTTYSTHDSSGELSQASFDRYVASMDDRKVNTLLLEPCINIKNDEGKAVDFRCLVSLDGNGEWTNVLTYARIGGSEVASNFSDGGSLNFALEVLEQLVPGQGEEKLAEINRVALDVSKLVQETSKNEVSWLGLDICLDRDSNQIYVIEANSKPGVKFVGPWPLALVRAQYFKYLLQKND